MRGSQAQAVLPSLHKGLGVRRSDLVRFTRPMWEVWGLDYEAPAMLRARLTWCIRLTLAQIGDERLERLGRAAYNVDADAALWQLKFLQRLDAVRGDKDATWARRGFYGSIQDPVVAALGRRLPGVPPEQLAQFVPQRLDADTASTEDLDRSIRHLYTSPYTDIVERFLKTLVFVPRGVRPGLIVTRTRRVGAWVCAYGNPELMQAHVRNARLPWNGTWDQFTGASLISRMRLLPIPAGLIFNPPPSTTADISRTLPLTASTVRQIWERL
jgi:hypothetical protein